MSDAESFLSALNTTFKGHKERLRIFRATVTSIASGLVSFQRGDDDEVNDAGTPRLLIRAPLVGDDIALIDVGGAPLVLGVIGATVTDDLLNIGRLNVAGGSPTLTAQTGAGTTATTAGQSGGTDTAGVIELIPGGTGIASGSQVLVTFATTRTTNYIVLLTPLTTAARTAGWGVAPANRIAASWTMTSDIALSSGSIYRWSYLVVGY